MWLELSGLKKSAANVLNTYMHRHDLRLFIRKYSEHDKEINSRITAVYKDHLPVYCTDNAICLLDLYYKKKMNDKFTNWMSELERSTISFDENVKVDDKDRNIFEIQKFRFIRYRKWIKYADEFDEYINNLINDHRIKIQTELKNLSKYSDYAGIDRHIDALMEYAWQTYEFDEGYETCVDLIKEFKLRESGSDTIVKEIINAEIKALNKFKLLFSHLRENVTEADDSVMSDFYRQQMARISIREHIKSLDDPSNIGTTEEYLPEKFALTDYQICFFSTFIDLPDIS